MTDTLAGLTLRDLSYAVAVDRARHFGRAAAACGISQAALSEQLRKLEDVLGGPLFERAHRRVEPTERGTALLHQAGTVLAEAHRLLEMAQRAAGLLGSRLRLGAIPTLAPYYLPHLLRQVRDLYPQLALQLAEGQTALLIDDLRRGQLDTALLALPILGDGFVAESLFFEPFRLVCPAGHPLAALDTPSLADLEGEAPLLLSEGHCLRDQTLELCHGASRDVRHAPSIETLWHMIAAGEGCSLLPALSAAGRETMAGMVTCHPLAETDAGRTIALVWRSTDPRSTELAALAAALRADLPGGVLARASAKPHREPTLHRRAGHQRVIPTPHGRKLV